MNNFTALLFTSLAVCLLKERPEDHKKSFYRVRIPPSPPFLQVPFNQRLQAKPHQIRQGTPNNFLTAPYCQTAPLYPNFRIPLPHERAKPTDPFQNPSGAGDCPGEKTVRLAMDDHPFRQIAVKSTSFWISNDNSSNPARVSRPSMIQSQVENSSLK